MPGAKFLFCCSWSRKHTWWDRAVFGIECVAPTCKAYPLSLSHNPRLLSLFLLHHLILSHPSMNIKTLDHSVNGGSLEEEER